MMIKKDFVVEASIDFQDFDEQIYLIRIALKTTFWPE